MKLWTPPAAVNGDGEPALRRCDECGEMVAALVEVGECYECECSPPELCLGCAERAFLLIRDIGRPAGGD